MGILSHFSRKSVGRISGGETPPLQRHASLILKTLALFVLEDISAKKLRSFEEGRKIEDSGVKQEEKTAFFLLFLCAHRRHYRPAPAVPRASGAPRKRCSPPGVLPARGKKRAYDEKHHTLLYVLTDLILNYCCFISA